MSNKPYHNDRENRSSKPFHKKASTWIAIGAIILIVLLLFWGNIVDIAGGGAD